MCKISFPATWSPNGHSVQEWEVKEAEKRWDLIHLIFKGHTGYATLSDPCDFQSDTWRWYMYMWICSLSICPARCDCCSERNDVERPHTRINAQCNRWCILLPFVLSAHTRTHAHTYTPTHTENNKQILTVFLWQSFYLFLGWHGDWTSHRCYPTVLATSSSYRSPGSSRWHMDECAMRMSSAPRQVGWFPWKP